jgi:hypothetical protein
MLISCWVFYDADLDLFSIHNYDRHSINFNNER